MSSIATRLQGLYNASILQEAEGTNFMTPQSKTGDKGISEAYEKMVSSLHKSSWALDIFSRYLGDIVRNKVRPRDTVPNEDKRMVDWALIKIYAKLFNSLKHGGAPTNALSDALRYKRKLWGKFCIYRTVSRHWCLISVPVVDFHFEGHMQIQKYCASNSESNVIESLFSRRSSYQDYERIPRDQRYLVQDTIPSPIHWSGLLRFLWIETVQSHWKPNTSTILTAGQEPLSHI